MAGPEDDRPASYGMEALAVLPVFFKLQGRIVVLAGATPPAVWKAELLAAAGAQVRVFDEAPSPEMLDLVSRHPGAGLTLIGQRWSPHDLGGAALAIGAFEDAEDAVAFRTAAQHAGVPVNVIDKPEYCDFQFGTILARSPIVIGISTDGAAPVFGQALRARIEAVLPANLGAWAAAAKAWRPAVQRLGIGFRARRRFWERFSRFALDGGEPSAQARQVCLAAAESGALDESHGRVVLVGSGPGTPESTTLGAIAALQSADCVVYDADVSPAVVGLARREADKLSSAQVDLPAIAEHATRKVVAWIGTGDPATCARWKRRDVELSQSGVRVELIDATARCPDCREGCRFRSTSQPDLVSETCAPAQ